MSTPEGRVKAKVNKYLKALGTKVYRFMPVQTGYGTRTVDYLLCVNGHFVGVETKAKGNKPTALQLITMQAIRDAGGMTFVVDDQESLEFMYHHLKQLCR